MRTPRNHSITVIVLALTLPPSVSWAWGERGHKIVGQVAAYYLSPRATLGVRQLLGERSLADVANWADDIKADPHYAWSRPWHYINGRPGADHIEFPQDCPERGCVLQAIIKYSNVLKNPNAASDERLDALRFLVHLVGDLHQPLHVAYADDKGGNDVSVVIQEHATNLHFAWDISMLKHCATPWDQQARQLSDKNTPQDLAQWRTLDIIKWADESFELARQQAYKIPAQGRLDQAYIDQAVPIVEERLNIAGVRLAYLLDAIFDDRAELPFAKMVADYGAPQLVNGHWRAVLDSPGGDLPFGLDIARSGHTWRAWLVNGDERIEIPQVTYEDGELTLGMEHYDSRIAARASIDGTRLRGEWKKRGGRDKWATLRFHARAGDLPRFKSYAGSNDHVRTELLQGRWAVQFASSEYPAVAIFDVEPDGSVTGTFLTPTGDYRYLAGRFERNHLRLSTFDGAHAFLFEAYLESDGTLRGDFWSRDSWHERWVAHRDPDASLPDPFSLTSKTADIDFSRLVFLDLDGRQRTLSEPVFAGRVRIIEIFGSWCPNCNDSARYLAELHRRYRDRGLSIVGLGFELTGDIERDLKQLRRFASRHDVEYPLLLAGEYAKDAASKALPVIDRLRSYPTAIFVDERGQIRAIHTGFAGPATTEAHSHLRREFEKLIEEMLSDPASP